MTETTLDIVEASPLDAEALLEALLLIKEETDYIAWQTPSSSFTKEALKDFLEWSSVSSNNICLVAKTQETILGLINIKGEEDPSLSHIGDVFIAVKRDYWNYGIGQILLDTAMTWAEESGEIKRLELTVQKRNKRAIHIYEKFGFEIEGLKKRGIKTKDGEFLDVYLMSKLIN